MFSNDNFVTGNSREIKYCTRCVTPNSRPRILFDEHGVCNACLNAEKKVHDIDWNARREEFLTYVNKYKGTNSQYDCIVPWSGGKDSSSIAYKLKFEFGLNPLLVTYSPVIPNEVGAINREAFIQLGFDQYFFRPNQKVHRKLAKRFFIERGNPKVAWDAGINIIPVTLATKLNIPLIFYAEHGETEYGGRILNKESQKIRNFTEVIEHQVGDDPRNWVDGDITEKDLTPYVYPDLAEVEKANVMAMYFAYFFKWSMYENYLYIKDKFNFALHAKGRTPGTFTNFDSLDDKMDDLYYYMQYVKFGFGRCIRDTSRFIMNGHMTRSEALELCKKYDGEFPEDNLDVVLEYLDLNRKEFEEIVDMHRNQELWERKSGKWELKFPLV